MNFVSLQLLTTQIVASHITLFTIHEFTILSTSSFIVKQSKTFLAKIRIKKIQKKIRNGAF